MEWWHLWMWEFKISRRFGVLAEEAKRRVIRRESRRSAFILQSFNADISNPINYDLTINTGKMSIDAAVEAVISAVMVTLGDTPWNRAASRWFYFPKNLSTIWKKIAAIWTDTWNLFFKSRWSGINGCCLPIAMIYTRPCIVKKLILLTVCNIPTIWSG